VGLPSAEVKNRDAMVLAALLLAENPDISHRKIAPHIGVDVSTLSRWRERADFRALIASVGTVKNAHVLLRQRPAWSPKRKRARGNAIKR
jgi:transposase-like protein